MSTRFFVLTALAGLAFLGLWDRAGSASATPVQLPPVSLADCGMAESEWRAAYHGNRHWRDMVLSR